MAQPEVEQRKEVGAANVIEKPPARKTVKLPDQRVVGVVAQPSKKCETSVAARLAETYLPGTGEPLLITTSKDDCQSKSDRNTERFGRGRQQVTDEPMERDKENAFICCEEKLLKAEVKVTSNTIPKVEDKKRVEIQSRASERIENRSESKENGRVHALASFELGVNNNEVETLQGIIQSSRLNVCAAEFLPRSETRIKDGVLATPSSSLDALGSENVSTVVTAKDGVEFGSTRTVYDQTPPSIQEPMENEASAVKKSAHGGIYVTGEIGKTEIEFLVDTGAEITVISESKFQNLPKQLRNKFDRISTSMKVANGASVSAKGPVMCQLSVMGRSVLEAIYVVKLTDDGLLGMPVLTALGFTLKMDGVDMMQFRRPRKFRVTSTEDQEIPARSEALVVGTVSKKAKGDLMMEPVIDGQKERKFMIARTVSRPTEGKCVVRVFNPADQSVQIKRGESLAQMERVEMLTENDCPTVRKIMVDEVQMLPSHVQELFDETCKRESLSPKVSKGLQDLLRKYDDLFARDSGDLGRTTLVQHSINTGDAKPIRQPPRRVPIALQPELEKEVKNMLEKGVIEPGTSPWSSPVVLVRKKDGTVRFCVDYRQLNAVTQFDAYPLPRIDETLEALGGAKFFSTLDLLSGYWQVGLTDDARLKSAFTVRGGLYLWNVMPFGLSNAPGTFERLMETVLQGLHWNACLVYLDDIVIFGRTEEELLQRMDIVFDRLRAAGLKLKPSKYHLFARSIDYLGHVISENGISVDPNKITAITEWPIPKSITEVRSFLGTASYYRRFVKNFAAIASPLHALTRAGTKFCWNEKHQKAFEQLKTALTTTPVLKFPVADAPYILDTDASLTGLGAVLSQVIDGQEYVLGYASKTLSRTEQNYCVTRRELLAVVKFVQHFRPYLYGRKFTVRTDHSSLQWLLNFREPENQLARWLQVLSEYDFVVHHRPGRQHGNADGLSRQVCRQCGRDEPQTEPKINLVTLTSDWDESKWCHEQLEDEDIRPVMEALDSGQRPSVDDVSCWTPAARRYWADWDRLRLVQGVLRRVWYRVDGSEDYQQIVVPRKMVKTLLEQTHDNPIAGHFSHQKTLQKLKLQFYWSRMAQDVRDWCRSCEVCNGRKTKPVRSHHKLNVTQVTEPLQRVAMDILGPLERSSDDNQYILVIVDYFTKYAEALPMKNQTAQECARCFVEGFVSRYGIPQQLHSDQGTQFESSLFQEMCKLLGLRKTRTTPGYAPSDGLSERTIRTIKEVLAKIAAENPRDWDTYLQLAMAAYRSTVHRATGETPNRLMFGREVITPVSLLAPGVPGKNEVNDWVETLRQKFDDVYEKVLTTTKSYQRGMKRYADNRAKEYNFTEGAKVSLWEPKPHKGHSGKLDTKRWTGPWTVTKKLSDCTYAIQNDISRKKRIINVDRLLPYFKRDPRQFPEEEIPEENRDNEPYLERETQEEINYEIHPEPEDEAGRESEQEAAQTLTTRAKRKRAKPKRFDDYIINKEDD